MDLTAINTDEDGYLLNYHDWSESLAEQIAQQEKLQLTEAHWEVIHLLRQLIDISDTSPSMRALVKLVKTQLGADKGRSIYLMQLFGESPAKLATKVAGLPKPEQCF